MEVLAGPAGCGSTGTTTSASPVELVEVGEANRRLCRARAFTRPKCIRVAAVARITMRAPDVMST